VCIRESPLLLRRRGPDGELVGPLFTLAGCGSSDEDLLYGDGLLFSRSASPLSCEYDSTDSENDKPEPVSSSTPRTILIELGTEEDGRTFMRRVACEGDIVPLLNTIYGNPIQNTPNQIEMGIESMIAAMCRALPELPTHIEQVYIYI